MSDQKPVEQEMATDNVRNIIRQTLHEFARAEQQKAEPAYKAELQEERKRRESLEQRLNQLVEENRTARAAAEEAERTSQIRSELQRLGVAKIDLAFRAVKDDITRGEDGRLQSKGQDARPLSEYLTHFVQENPELLPARIAGGSGAIPGTRKSAQLAEPVVSLEQIKPGMNKEDLDRVRQEISRLATQALRGL
ncbi:MAG TPA: hypothetical protein VF283_22610 [Bryobacteraceae bacterium]